MTVEIREAYKQDFEAIQKLLMAQFKYPSYWKDPWIELTKELWDKERGYIGYVLSDNNKICGFLGTLFSKRILKNKLYDFCNITSWAVDESHRNHSLRLIMPLLNMRGCVLTSLSAAKNVVIVFKKLGFKDLEDSQKIVLPLPFAIRPKKFKHTFEINEILPKLDQENKKICIDHSGFKCWHYYSEDDNNRLYMVITRVFRRGIPFANIQYISNQVMFQKYLNFIRNKIVITMKVFGIIIDSRFLTGNKIPFSFEHQLDQPKVYRSQDLAPQEIDNLYSEQILLNI